MSPCSACERRSAQLAALFEDGSVSEVCLVCAGDLVQCLPAFAGSVSVLPLAESAAAELAALACEA